jgi:hypothetical protein
MSGILQRIVLEIFLSSRSQSCCQLAALTHIVIIHIVFYHLFVISPDEAVRTNKLVVSELSSLVLLNQRFLNAGRIKQ